VEVKQETPAPAVKGRQYIWGTGRRKTSMARVRMADGSGAFTINGRPIEGYFTETQDRQAVTAPLDLLGLRANYDVFVNVKGGGHTGQAAAARMGLARALSKVLPEKESQLRDAGFLTRDSRMKERKKYGQRGARRRFQFSKR
jgi:small subunit ribosomal protein S9